jgi:hypothetical protein
MALAKSSGHETLKLVSFGHRECIGKKAEAKEANWVSAKCAIYIKKGCVVFLNAPAITRR